MAKVISTAAISAPTLLTDLNFCTWKKLLFLELTVIALVVLGCACLFRTKMLVEWARKDYLRSGRAVQAWPFSNLVLRASFTIYLRMIGVYVLLFAILVAYEVFQLLQQS